MNLVRQQSRTWRVVLIIVVVYTVLRLVVHGMYLATLLWPEQGALGERPGWVGEKEGMIPADLQIYLNAARHFKLRQDLYLKGSLERLEEHFPYAPFFALVFMPFLGLSPVMVTVVHTLLHTAAYALLYVWWGRIFRRLKLDYAVRAWVWTLPVWLLFSSFWTDLGYLNIYIIMALFGTWFIEAVLYERLGWSLLWLSIILQIKPHWAFALVVPLLLGRRRFFFKLLASSILVYGAVVGMTIWIAGWSYGWQQHVDYVHFLARLSRDFPWRGPEQGFLGYNHSIKQIVVYLAGVSPAALRWATGVKILLLLPLAVVGLRYLFHPPNRAGQDAPRVALDLAFVYYLGAFIWLDMVWEVSLGMPLYAYLLGTSANRGVKRLIGAVFLPYALLDPWRVASFVVGGMSVILPGPYVATDPAIYVPLIMVVILTFYALLIKRLWRASQAQGVQS